MDILAPQRITLEFRFPVQLGIVVRDIIAELDSDHEFLAQHEIEGFRSAGISERPEDDDSMQAIKRYEFLGSHSEEKNERMMTDILDLLKNKLGFYQKDIKIHCHLSPA